MKKSRFTESQIISILSQHEQGRKVADTALFLASKDSKYIYRAVIPVDGGLLR